MNLKHSQSCISNFSYLFEVESIFFLWSKNNCLEPGEIISRDEWRKHLTTRFDRTQQDQAPSMQKRFPQLRHFEVLVEFWVSLSVILDAYTSILSPFSVTLLSLYYSSGVKKLYMTVFRTCYCRSWMSSKSQERLGKKLQRKGECERKKKEKRRGRALYFSRRDLIVHGIWTVEQMGVSRRENRRNVIPSEIIPWLIPFPSRPPLLILRRRDHLSRRSDDSTPKRRSVRANLPPVPFIRPDKSL